MADSSDVEDLFASPSARAEKQKKKAAAAAAAAGSTTTTKSRSGTVGSEGRPKTPVGGSRFDSEQQADAREEALRRELQGVKAINEVVEGVLGTLERAKGNMNVCLGRDLFRCRHRRRKTNANGPPTRPCPRR